MSSNEQHRIDKLRKIHVTSESVDLGAGSAVIQSRKRKEKQEEKDIRQKRVRVDKTSEHQVPKAVVDEEREEM